MSSIQLVGKYKFDNSTSEIGLKFGRVYIYCENDYMEKTYYLQDHFSPDRITWLETFKTKAEVEKMGDVFSKYYLDSTEVAKVDWVLKRLLGLSHLVDSDVYKHAVSNSESARGWAKDLKKADDQLNWWFGNGCPMPQEELDIIIKWSKQETPTDKLTQEKRVSNRILCTMKKAQEMQIENESTRK